MPKVKLTERTLRGLTGTDRIDFYDETFGGGLGQFGVRVAGDRKIWFYLYYPPGQRPTDSDSGGRAIYRRRRATLGLYVPAEQKIPGSAALTLAEARALAKEAEAKIAQGVDPFPPGTVRPAQRLTVQALWTEYRLAVEQSKPSVRQEEALLRKHAFCFRREGWARPFGEMDARDAARAHLRAIIAVVAEGSAETSAVRVKTAVSACFTWAAARYDDEDESTHRYPEGNVFLRLTTPMPPRRPRERWLAEHELRPFWLACQEDASTLATAALPLVLLTFQRPGEVLQMRRSAIDLKARLWSLPAEVMKSRRPHIVPLSEPAVRLIEAALETVPTSRDYLFIRRMPQPVTLAGRRTPAFDSALLGGVRERFEQLMVEAGHPAPERWSPRDLRRSGRTHAGRMGLSVELLERIMDHAVPTLIGTYDRHAYIEERRQVLERWGAKCMRLMLDQEEPGGMVVTMPRRSA